MSRVVSAPPSPVRGYAARRVIGAAAAAVMVWAVLGMAWSSAASLDDQVHAIARQLMCPVCQGQTVADSDAALAREMKVIIRQKLLAGETPDQIVRYFVAQFGDGILAEPHPGGVSLILYAGPPLALIAGVVIAVVFIRGTRSRAGSRTAPSEPEPAPPLRREA